MNSFGVKFKFTSFGQSHGKALGCIIDGVPAGIKIDLEFIQEELNKRKPGQNEFASPRKEDDKVEVLSGLFKGYSTNTPIALVVFNQNQKSKDYENIKDIFRLAHGDFTYFHKYGLRDYEGGGRTSARESIARVCAGAVAKLMLKELDVKILGGICQIGDIEAKEFDFSYAKTSQIFALDKNIEVEQKNKILEVKKSHDSIGGVALIKALSCPIGLGEPIYNKLDARIAFAMMSINGVKAVEIGAGIKAPKLKGSQNNDELSCDGFKTNNSGGILAGLSNGDDIIVKVHFKPTPSIFIEQNTVNTKNENTKYKIKGRHDPCIAPRGSIIAEAMLACVLADFVLLNTSSNISQIKKVYKNNENSNIL